MMDQMGHLVSDVMLFQANSARPVASFPTIATVHELFWTLVTMGSSYSQYAFVGF